MYNGTLHNGLWMVFGQFPPRKIAPQIISPWMIAPGLPEAIIQGAMITPKIIVKYAPGSCPQGKLSFG